MSSELPAEHGADEARIRRFLAIASHDLQSPLRHISMYAEILLEDLGETIDGEHLQSLKTIRDKAQTAQRLTKALMGFATGSPAITITEVDLDAIVRDIWAELSAEAEGYSATLKADALPTIRTDATIVGLVLRSIVSNALVHNQSPVRHVTIEAEQDAGAWKIHVTDDGPGIEPGCQASIFDAFWKTPQADNRTGVGLGLTAARDLLAALGGSIYLGRSGEDGSRFTIVLPAS
ncbi:ATP-binding protein [Rhizobium sp. S96]|uniref:sensor histidine kinase n=1 Tax=Rhizobium sp. S96 TaxID=3055140 RepID=UPI0025AA5961|nr:ATP-binding protein [Rhizobium sp. S96]MDM9619031.1 ATP-binding protein [Rhizobium sp. S96]